MLSKQALSTKLSLIALIILLIFLGRLEFKQWQAQRQVEKQKQALKEQVEEKQKKNDELNKSLQYLSSGEFKEKVARQQLGLKRQGEDVYNFTDASSNSAEQPLNPKSNFIKWWNYIFSEN